jgi:hypothetical protein
MLSTFAYISCSRIVYETLSQSSRASNDGLSHIIRKMCTHCTWWLNSYCESGVKFPLFLLCAAWKDPHLRRRAQFGSSENGLGCCYVVCCQTPAFENCLQLFSKLSMHKFIHQTTTTTTKKSMREWEKEK